jgi:hypothetical protein
MLPRISLLVVLLAAGGPAWAWDVTPVGVLVMPAGTNLQPEPGTFVAVASDQTYDEGSKLRIDCGYKYLAPDLPVSIPAWSVQITVDGKPVGSVPASMPTWTKKTHTDSDFISSKTTTKHTLNPDVFTASVEWTASGDGKHTVQCLLNPGSGLGEENINNNITQTGLFVKKFEPLAGGSLPPVSLTSPTGSASYTLGQSLAIPVSGKIAAKQVDGKKDLVEYAEASPFEESWIVEVVYKGDGKLGGFESKVGELSGPADSLSFSTAVTGAWLLQHQAKPGHYAVRAYLVQKAGAASVTGPNDRVDFELVPLQNAKSSQGLDAQAPGAVPVPPSMMRKPAPGPGPRPNPTVRTLPGAAGAPSVRTQPAAQPAVPGVPSPVVPNLPAVQQPVAQQPGGSATPVAPNLPAVQQPVVQQPAEPTRR